MIVNVAGSPGPLGGASVEVGDFIRLLLKHGVEVHVVDPAGREVSVDGCVCHSRDDLPEGPVVSFCNSRFVQKIQTYGRFGPIVWVPCMSRASVVEIGAFRRFQPDAVVFQSRYQQETYVRSLVKVDLGNQYRIRGVFFPEDWEYSPRSYSVGDGFTVGRICRADRFKWIANYYQVLSEIEDIRAINVGVDRNCKERIGRTPPWAKEYAPGSVDVRTIYPQLHAMWAFAPLKENWPRIGLESMACGVPIVASNSGGWKEMIGNGTNGFLADSVNEALDIMIDLAANEELRLEVADNARKELDYLADEDAIWMQWKELLESI